MAVESPQGLLDALSEGRDGDIEGTEESGWCEFKSHPYDLDDDKSRWELAKDVSALANAQGGVIVVAVRTVKPDDRDEEIAERVVPVLHKMIDRKRIQDVIRRLTYPPLGARVDLHLFGRGSRKVLLAIRVLQAADDQWPTLVVREFTDAGRSVESFAVARRVGAHAEWLPVGQVHRDISDGRLGRRGQSSDLSPDVVAEQEARYARRIDQIIEYLGWGDLAVHLLAAIPQTRKNIADFYGQDGIRGTLNSLASYGVRDSGFGLGYGFDVRTEEGSLVTSDKDRVVWIDRDGFLVCATAGTEEFLGWAQERFSRPQVDGRRALRINRIVLAEYTFEFCRFVAQELMPRLQDDAWRLISAGRLARSGLMPLVLPGRDGLGAGLHEAILDTWDEIVTASGDYEQDAFALLERTFEMFGLPSESIPFSAHGRVVEETIRSI
jgi:hypothetical protein